jgi:hypothetical protein
VIPLIYSTEIARSYKITEPEKLILDENGIDKTYNSSNKKAQI